MISLNMDIINTDPYQVSTPSARSILKLPPVLQIPFSALLPCPAQRLMLHDKRCASTVVSQVFPTGFVLSKKIQSLRNGHAASPLREMVHHGPTCTILERQNEKVMWCRLSLCALCSKMHCSDHCKMPLGCQKPWRGPGFL